MSFSNNLQLASCSYLPHPELKDELNQIKNVMIKAWDDWHEAGKNISMCQDKIKSLTQTANTTILSFMQNKRDDVELSRAITIANLRVDIEVSKIDQSEFGDIYVKGMERYTFLHNQLYPRITVGVIETQVPIEAIVVNSDQSTNGDSSSNHNNSTPRIKKQKIDNNL